MRSLLPALLALLIFVVAVRAEEGEGESAPKPQHDKPYLWVVEGPTRVFLFGTIHVPEERVLALPKIVEDAFAASDTVTTEIAMDAAAMAEVNRLSQELSALPEGKTLRGVLPDELYARIEALLPAGVQLSALDGRQPWFVWFLLIQLQMMPYSTKGMPLDSLLHARGQKEGKELGAIETAAQQLGIFSSLTLDQQIRMLDLAVQGYEEARAEGRDLIGELIDLYLEGDENAFLVEMNKDWDPEDPLGKRLLKSMLHDRNVRMADAVLAKIEAQPEKTHFVAVGAGHMAGGTGIPRLLEEKGLTVRRLKVTDELPVAQPVESE